MSKSKSKPLRGLCQVKRNDESEWMKEDGRNEQNTGNTVRRKDCAKGHKGETAW